jgi:hypothetical protein
MGNNNAQKITLNLELVISKKQTTEKENACKRGKTPHLGRFEFSESSFSTAI